MITLYCKKNHESERVCPECKELMAYSDVRAECCPNIEEDVFCSKCSTQCYSKDKKQVMGKVMRYAGPRMLFYHPLLLVRHIFQRKQQRKNIERNQLPTILLTLTTILDIISSAFCKDFESKSPASKVFIETRITKTTNKEDSYENIYGKTRFY
ncbi:hypothetical protein AZF37_08490 [endosymbiont 'TC1' of Trimyema compressum]|nr:hypothetical protein AZF37_08490 [endosymbiont 'TC1' of Trimyema compressum]